MVDNFTNGVDSAVARVDALGVKARLVVGTLRVGLASHDWFGCQKMELSGHELHIIVPQPKETVQEGRSVHKETL